MNGVSVNISEKGWLLFSPKLARSAPSGDFHLLSPSLLRSFESQIRLKDTGASPSQQRFLVRQVIDKEALAVAVDGFLGAVKRSLGRFLLKVGYNGSREAATSSSC